MAAAAINLPVVAAGDEAARNMPPAPAAAAAVPGAQQCTKPADPGLAIGGRQELAIRRFTQYCSNPTRWGVLLFHKVGTGKTMVSLLIALHSITDLSLPENNTQIVIVAPTGLYKNFTDDLCKMENHRQYINKLISYPINDLVADVMNKNIRIDFTNKIVIIDEAHRLLLKNIADSLEAGAITSFHPMIQDIYFKNKIAAAQRCIIMTGTPIQKDLSDVCKLLNFVSKTNEFTRETYAPIKISQASHRWARAYLANAYANPSIILEWVIKPAVFAGGALLTAMQPSAVPPAEAETTVITTTNVIIATNILIAAGTMAYVSYTGSKALAAVERDKIKTWRVQKGGSLGGAVSFISDFLGLPVSPPVALQLCLHPWISHNQERIEELTENVWDAEYLAEHASEFTSVYDPDIDQELTPGFSPDFMDTYDADSTSLGRMIQPVDSRFGFPEQIDQVYAIEYDEYQIKILNEMYSGDLPLTIKRILYLEEYNPPIANNKASFGSIRKYARMIGNFSPHLEQYYVVKNRDSTRYIVLDRGSGTQLTAEEIRRPIPYTRMYQEETAASAAAAARDELLFAEGAAAAAAAAPALAAAVSVASALVSAATAPPRAPPRAPARAAGPKLLFDCPKFSNLLNKLLAMRRTGTVPVAREPAAVAGGDPLFERHAHLYNTEQYLPLVYSYTEDYGLALFAAFLEANGYSYILLHPSQVDTEATMFTAAKSTYPPMGAELDPANNILCVLIHPTMTEGFNFTRNPALFCLEPCNTFGDSEQVYGRIFRRYNNSDDILSIRHTQDPTVQPPDRYPPPPNQPRVYPAEPLPYPQQPKKLIGLYVCITRNDSIQLYKNFKRAANKLQKTEVLFTVPDMKDLLFGLRFESPDFFGFRRLQRERNYLKMFEENVYGGTAGDLVESHACHIENRTAVGLPYVENLLDGRGMVAPRPRYTRTTGPYQLVRNPEAPAPILSPTVLPQHTILRRRNELPAIVHRDGRTFIPVETLFPQGAGGVDRGYIHNTLIEENPFTGNIMVRTTAPYRLRLYPAGNGPDPDRTSPSEIELSSGTILKKIIEQPSIVSNGVTYDPVITLHPIEGLHNEAVDGGYIDRRLIVAIPSSEVGPMATDPILTTALRKYADSRVSTRKAGALVVPDEAPGAAAAASAALIPQGGSRLRLRRITRKRNSKK